MRASVSKGGILAAAVAGSSLAFIDSTALGVALPTIQRELSATPGEAQWMADGYLLLLGALVLTGGAAGDRIGRRRIFTVGVLLFVFASVLCALAPSARFLVGARMLQGLGSALLTPASLALIGANFSEAERGRAFGLWSGFGALAGLVGPLLGGALTDAGLWRLLFWANVPLGAMALALTFRFTPESRDPSARGLDVPGAALVSLALAALTWAFTELSTRALDVRSGAAFAAGLGLFVAFLGREATTASPMLPLALFRSRVFAGMNVLTLLLYFALGGAMFFLPFELIRVHHFKAAQAGATMLPFAVVMGLFSGAAGKLADRVGPRPSLTVGPLLTGVGFALLGLMAPSSSSWLAPLPGVLALSCGMTLTVGPLTASVMNAVEGSHTGVASGINNAVARVANLLAIAALGVVLAWRFRAVGGQALSEVMSGEATGELQVLAFHRAIAAVMFTCAACAAAAGLAGLLTAPRRAAPR